ncbi:MAG TPA: ABC transporter permease subunit/CPBP intramembrane protease, partial [Gemmataceae bacterium]|nr:ABC transporter permease subunit/CPBP intramembrane protease [Gemmataceae bacterium]
MRWSIVRLIWLRELRDQLRDRRTLLMVAGLPLLLYPILGVAVLNFAVGFGERKSIIGIVNGPDQPMDFPTRPQGEGLSPLPPFAWLTTSPGTFDNVVGAAALNVCSHTCLDYPQLVHNGKIGRLYLQQPSEKKLVPLNAALVQLEWLDKPRRDLLDEKKIDVMVSVGPDFWSGIEHGQPAITVEARDNDDSSRLAVQRLQFVLARWKKHIKEVRFVRNQLPNNFDDPFTIHEPDADKSSPASRTALDMLVRIFPFMLVMWSLAGALYPAVDLCAGEKERGTMETLLISPASREEIVWGKFLTIWVFSAGTAFLNVLSMGVTTWFFAAQLPRVDLTTGGLFWCIVLLLPLAAFFSAVCLSIGAYARSSKEGQYYLMPLFVITMPLIFLTLAPGVELNSFYSMVPVTGVALLMQRLLTSPNFEQPWFYIVSVMAPMGLYSWLALRWAIDQFQREEVLFREAERIDVRLWLRRLLRNKETRPTTAQAMFCFGLLLGLRWLSQGLGSDVPLLARSLIIVTAFVAGPPVFMGLLLTTRPRQVLALHWPAWPYLAASVLLVPLVELAVTELPFWLSQHMPRLLHVLQERQMFVERAFTENGESSRWWAVGLAMLTAAGKEIAFRGFIFAGLLKRMQPWPAILVSSFLFAAYHMNVFLLPPLFLLGIALGVLALRSG